MMYRYKFWNNGKYELIAAGSTGKRLEWEEDYGKLNYV
jgi:hypothetical protein